MEQMLDKQIYVDNWSFKNLHLWYNAYNCFFGENILFIQIFAKVTLLFLYNLSKMTETENELKSLTYAPIKIGLFKPYFKYI